ncbi:MAG: hypothetical protein K2Q23_03170 [Bryobacteraceae bacterium]|nr:hypothetical protein [Bryobacteraceae bacterium]
MKIQGPGPNRPVQGPDSTQGPQQAEPQKKFSAASAGVGRTAAPGPVEASGLVAELQGSYSAADLNDPGKKAEMMREVMNRVLDEQAQALNLSGDDRQKIADWMGQDPLIQGRVERMLEKILS